MMLLYIRPIKKHRHLPAFSEELPQPTSRKPEVESEQADTTNLRQAKNTESRRNTQQIYYLERRSFV